jgi:hypothetical protein
LAYEVVQVLAGLHYLSSQWWADRIAPGLGDEGLGNRVMPVSRLRQIRERQQVARAIDISIVGITGDKPLDSVRSIGVYTGDGKA